MSILDVLVEKKIINRYQTADIINKAAQQNIPLDAVLADMGLDEEKILDAKSLYYGIPKKKVNFDDISFDLLQTVPEDSARNYQFVPVGMSDGMLEIGMTDPTRLEATNALQFIASKNNLPYRIVLVTYSDLKKVLESYRGLSTSTEEVSGFDNEEPLDVGAPAEESGFTVEQDATNIQKNTIVEDAPVTKMLNVILQNASDGGASDIHIEHIGDKVKVRFRVDGTLYTSLLLPKNIHSALVARVKILAKLKLDEKRKPQDGRFYARVSGRQIDYRVSTLPTFFGEKVVIRILDPEKGVKPLGEIGMSPLQVEMVARTITRPYGLVLITGPTGSGKTTTLYSMLNLVDREKLNVVSLEEPIEYTIPGMNQSQVRPEIGYTFANGLRSILRQDPNVIMVGEIRDKETAQLAIQASLTGHLVFATLHTNNAIGVVPRLVDMGVDPYLIAPTLILAIAQRLVRKIAPDCGVPFMDESVRILIEKEFADLPVDAKQKLGINEGAPVYQAVPNSAYPSGIKGRIPVFEMFEIDKDIEHVILTNPVEDEIYKLARAKGMISMKEDAIIKSMQAIVPYSEVNTL